MEKVSVCKVWLFARNSSRLESCAAGSLQNVGCTIILGRTLCETQTRRRIINHDFAWCRPKIERTRRSIVCSWTKKHRLARIDAVHIDIISAINPPPCHRIPFASPCHPNDEQQRLRHIQLTYLRLMCCRQHSGRLIRGQSVARRWALRLAVDTTAAFSWPHQCRHCRCHCRCRRSR